MNVIKPNTLGFSWKEIFYIMVLKLLKYILKNPEEK